MKAVIMAGGKGTRIASIRSDIPKPMIDICGKPILEYQVEQLRAYDITEIILVIGYQGHVIKEYFGDGTAFGVTVSYFEEVEPLGTAGALFKIPDLYGDFLLLCGDILFNVDIQQFIQFHIRHNAFATLTAHPNNHPFDSSLLVTEIVPPQSAGDIPQDTHKVIRWINKEDARHYYKNRVNAGIQIISSQLLTITQERLKKQYGTIPEKLDLDRDLLKPNISTGKIYAYDTPEYIKDMGTPDRYYQTELDIKSGLFNSRNLLNKQKAVFLDRDGTINKLNGFITTPDQFELIEGAAEAVRMINQSGYLAIVITNQPIIARGECTFEQLRAIHDKMETELGKRGAFIDGLYLCPHHTDKGFAGERVEYKCDCECRKPKPGLLLRAAADLNIDLSQSIMVGDTERDIQAGKAAGCRECILVTERYTLADWSVSLLNCS